MKLEQTEKKRLLIFLGVAFLLPYVLGILMGYGYFNGLDVSIFPSAQMFYPAAGIMLAVLLTKREGEPVPVRYYVCFLVVTALMLVLTLLSVFTPGTWVLGVMNMVMIFGSIACWFFLLTEKKEKRKTFGLCLGNGKQSIWMVVLFLIFYFGRVMVSAVLSGTQGEILTVFTDFYTYVMLFSILLNFFFVFTAFFGEEYGWRYYFAPFLEKHFGSVRGVLLLGVLWGLWHLPINVFFYSPDTWLQSILSQQITCIGYSIFFTYAYKKSGTIWVPVMIHMLNNNLVLLFSGGDASVISGQIIGWGDLVLSLVINVLCFVPFLFTKEFKKTPETAQSEHAPEM